MFAVEEGWEEEEGILVRIIVEPSDIWRRVRSRRLRLNWSGPRLRWIACMERPKYTLEEPEPLRDSI